MKQSIKRLAFLSYVTLFSCLLSCKKSDVTEIKKEAIQSSANNQLNGTLVNGLNLSEYVFFGADEFNGATLDTTVWFLRRENDPTYGPPNTRSNITVNNGFLTLVTKEPPAGLASSAEISTETRPNFYFRYGYFETRAQLSSGVGNSCAFWLTSPATSVVSNPFNPAISGAEIDIFESGIGLGINKLFYSLHWNGYVPPYGSFITQTDSLPGIYSGFHTFALEWTPKKYTIYVDGIQRVTTDTIISHIPSFIILGLGPGGFGGSASLFPNPSSFIVDYIRVYNRRPEVTLYGNINYRGWVSNGLLAGSYTTSQIVANGGIDNMLSSLEIPPGWTVTLFDGDNFSGNSIILNSGDTVNLGAWNSTTSSLKITSP